MMLIKDPGIKTIVDKFYLTNEKYSPHPNIWVGHDKIGHNTQPSLLEAVVFCSEHFGGKLISDYRAPLNAEKIFNKIQKQYKIQKIRKDYQLTFVKKEEDNKFSFLVMRHWTGGEGRKPKRNDRASLILYYNLSCPEPEQSANQYPKTYLKSFTAMHPSSRGRKKTHRPYIGLSANQAKTHILMTSVFLAILILGIWAFLKIQGNPLHKKQLAFEDKFLTDIKKSVRALDIIKENEILQSSRRRR